MTEQAHASTQAHGIHRRRSVRGARLAVAATSATVLVAACGSTAGVGGTATVDAANAASPLKYATCMRSHGVPNFPDPGAGGGFAISPSSGLNPQSPTFAKAAGICAQDFPGGGRAPHIPAKARAQLLAMARCMRAHGVSDFPDPTFGTGGGAALKIVSARQLDADSPAFQTAARICNGPRLQIAVGNPDGGGAVRAGG
jgi:hypothetical protein